LSVENARTATPAVSACRVVLLTNEAMILVRSCEVLFASVARGLPVPRAVANRAPQQNVLRLAFKHGPTLVMIIFVALNKAKTVTKRSILELLRGALDLSALLHGKFDVSMCNLWPCS
jgi:hypothetical protein